MAVLQPLMDFDRLFGTWKDYGEWVAAKDAKKQKSK
jgi:hypothetical protein